ncbi:MAG: DotA/TraY family protein [Alphaproteobacteria bacterium]|nr:DotA/TraY family protein [Alphaproteobacteria bacterium]
MKPGTAKILRYALLPELLPRIRALAFSGLGPLAFFVAYVYYAARLLPSGHPYLNPTNGGRFGVLHVVWEARQNLFFRWKNVDQIILFFMIPAGLLIFLIQLALLGLALFISTADAMTLADLGRFLKTPDPHDDIAFMLLDGTFGIERATATGYLFGSKVATENAWGTWPTPFHEALHEMFGFYSTGLFFVAITIMVYFTITIIAETAHSGTPFGQRFERAWVPLRLIVAVSLLVPLSSGLNGGQLITLYIAKGGSGLATNGWNIFTDEITGGTLLGDPKDFVTTPSAPQISNLMEIVFIARTCSYLEKYVHGREVKPYLVFQNKAKKNYFTTDLNAALAFSEDGDVMIRFGEYDAAYAQYPSSVRPVCGEVTIHPVDLSTPGALAIQNDYYNLVGALWDNFFMDILAETIAERVTPTINRSRWSDWYDDFDFSGEMESMVKYYYDPANDDSLPAMIKRAVEEQIGSPRWASVGSATWNEAFKKYGWAGAGLWYNQIAELNGSLIGAVRTVPDVSLYPEVMEHVRQQNRLAARSVSGTDSFQPVLPGGRSIEFAQPGDEYIALGLYYAQSFWIDKHAESTGNVFTDTTRLLFDMDGLSALFGLEGLFNMTRNPHTHPLAQLTGIGASLVQNAVSKLLYSMGAGVTGKVLGVIKWERAGKLATAASQFFLSIATMGLLIGCVLYYVLPFLPFLYFFFAVGKWLKTIFEAMVGLPLWALAHIRIDGKGLPGPVAMSGYYLILEIFLRPILIVIGLLGGISIFAAQVFILNDIWALVVSNLSGYDQSSLGMVEKELLDGQDPRGSLLYMRGAVDTLFFTVLYAIVVYMIGMSSFKLVDLVPNKIMRWLGTGVSTFAEQAEDPAQALIGRIYSGSSLALGQISGAYAGILLRN